MPQKPNELGNRKAVVGRCRPLAVVLLGICAATCACSSLVHADETRPEGRVVHLRDITTIEGVRENPLIGYGLVVGLKRTGDSQQTQLSTQTLANILQRMGLQIPVASVQIRNAAALANLQNQNIVSGQTAINFYSGIVFQVGSDAANASSQLSGEQLLVQQLQDQVNAISGVSLDEEGANLVLYQNAYNASARVASIVASLFQTAINMTGG
ncbi:MAG TPA: flagellar basal body P-ring protein FlgI [Candidatus Dormibacteraeota bacterium]|nr:flagellar basal body P-ring protein FlgI [Candidatus Dormibacteraeota bacterium]